jgi:hypothetical protein
MPKNIPAVDPRVDVQIAMELLDDLQGIREDEDELNDATRALLNEICADIDDAAMAFSVDSDFALLAAMTPEDFH